MDRYKKTRLWQSTLAPQIEADAEEACRAKLCSAYEGFREKARLLAGEIARDLPDFTVHDISHIDALWEMADLVAGDKFTLTPPEAFVLGGAFLIHDLGMGIAAYPAGPSELNNNPLWSDTVASLLRKKWKRSPLSSEIQNPPHDIAKQAAVTVLRELHAKNAELLALVSWQDPHYPQDRLHLLEDSELRRAYGQIIGQIAHSHWWPVGELEQKLPKIKGALGGYANNWTVDPIKIACLLRAADIIHLDDRRAPVLLHALRKPPELSATHWTFQEKLYQPSVKANRLVFTSKCGFTKDEHSAWWTCVETLQAVDAELRQVDSLLVDSQRQRLEAHGVSYIENIKRLAELIETDGWLPVDAKIKVGDVASLVGNLGGAQLYGRDELVPLRELIQNATDAVRARRLHQGLASEWGNVTVRVGQDSSGGWLEVEDDGVGMSPEVITGPFLDFGTSFWGSPFMHRELPGLEGKGFISTGRFGIGFFSVFMWADRVRVSTRRYDNAHEDTWILEFDEGLGVRPVLRKAISDEVMQEGGTRVRVWFKDFMDWGQVTAANIDEEWNLTKRCAWLCPTLDANLYVEADGKLEKAVSASDWVDLSPLDFFNRILGQLARPNDSQISAELERLGQNLRILRNSSGEIVGRACIYIFGGIEIRPLHWATQFTLGVISVGGFRSITIPGVCGVLLGEADRAARDSAAPVAESAALKQWSTDQAEVATHLTTDAAELANIAATVRAYGGSMGTLPICYTADGWLNESEVSQVNCPEIKLHIVSNGTTAFKESFEISLYQSVFAVNDLYRSFITSRSHYVHSTDNEWHLIYGTENEQARRYWKRIEKTLTGAIIAALANSWQVSIEEVLLASSLWHKGMPTSPVGEKNGDILVSVYKIRRPRNA